METLLEKVDRLEKRLQTLEEKEADYLKKPKSQTIDEMLLKYSEYPQEYQDKVKEFMLTTSANTSTHLDNLDRFFRETKHLRHPTTPGELQRQPN